MNKISMVVKKDAEYNMSAEYEFLAKVLAAKNNIPRECVIANRNLDHRQTCVEPLTEQLWCLVWKQVLVGAIISGRTLYSPHVE